MDKLKTLQRYGLFDAKVPRYTSYPPANRFRVGAGQAHQDTWLRALDPDKPVSLYIHIPFCRRLCWFCACRTQGTKTMRPVDDYLTAVLKEIATVAATAPQGLKMERLHLGGGTPTLLTGAQMARLLGAVHAAFGATRTFEFSVEIDPTEGSDEVLNVLAKWGLGRASIGVQDFAPKVQDAIGRLQSSEETERVISQLRADGIHSLNIDLLYGLPHQTGQTLLSTLDKVAALRPDRLALYGYAHVPHVSKRQVMIDENALPDPQDRFRLAQLAADHLRPRGYESLGIDHFALPHDSLTKAKTRGRMKRNFQGYNDDPCDTLIGFGASAISQFPGGYVQNAVATMAYRNQIGARGLAGHKGYVMSETDKLISHLIESLMCNGCIAIADVRQRFPSADQRINDCLLRLRWQYADALKQVGDTLTLDPNLFELARLISAELDDGLRKDHIHSLAV